MKIEDKVLDEECFGEALKRMNGYDRYCSFCKIVYWLEGCKTFSGQRTKCDKCDRSLRLVNIA